MKACTTLCEKYTVFACNCQARTQLLSRVSDMAFQWVCNKNDPKIVLQNHNDILPYGVQAPLGQ